MMATAKLYTAVDFGGPFLDWLLEHFRRQQQAGEGLDLHLQAENPEDKVSLHQVMVVPRSKLIGDLVTSGLPITLHIPEASVDTLDLLVQLLYGVGVEVSEDVLPRLRSICKALGLGDWLEETLLTEKDLQPDVSATEIKEPKEEIIMRDETLKESESLPDPLDVSVVCVARRSPRVQALQCELCDKTCFSLASLQRHYDADHFVPASGKRVKGGRVVKSTPGKTFGGFKDCGVRRSRRMSVAKTLLSDVATDQECRVNLKDLKKQGGLFTEYLGKGKSAGSQLPESAGRAKVSGNGGLLRDQAFAVESSLVENRALDANITKAAEDYGHFMKVAEESLIRDASMSGGRKLKQRGRTQTAGASSSKHQETVQARAVTCPRKMLDKGLPLKKDELMRSSLKKGENRDEDCNGVEKGRKRGTSRRLTTPPRLRSRQSNDGSGGEDVNETVKEKEEYFFLLWNKFLANKVVPGSGRLRQHLPSVLKSFFSVRAGQINKHALLPQALQHVSNLEEEGLLSEEAASKLLAMLQETIQF